jgi:SulP family sulfate permease
MKRMSDEAAVVGWKYVNDESDPATLELRQISKHIRVYEICGPMFFAAVGQLNEIAPKDFTKCIIFRMRSVPSVDTDALKALKELVKKFNDMGITVIFSHVNSQPLRAMKKSGLFDMVKAENFCANIDEALNRAEKLG